MLNGITVGRFEDMSDRARSRGKKTVQRPHRALECLNTNYLVDASPAVVVEHEMFEDDWTNRQLCLAGSHLLMNTM